MKTISSRWDQYLQRRSRNLGWSMVVMGLSFALYYLGLFGNETGPLSPDKIAGFLGGLGVDRTIFISFFFAVFFISVSWNHCINLFLRLGEQKHSEKCIRKGLIAHTIWIGALLLFLIVLWHAK